MSRKSSPSETGESSLSFHRDRRRVFKAGLSRYTGLALKIRLLGSLALNRFVLGWIALWKSWTEPEFAERVEGLLSKAPTGPDLRVLAVLQRDGRLVDFLQEDIDPYTDAQIGAAVRDIHRGCRKALRDYLTVSPILPGAEESEVTIAPDFDPASIRLTGNVQGSPPFRGVLKHHGWRVEAVHLPALPGARDQSSVLAPAEVEIS
jgi:Domain of unknown function (DUF2760)